MNTVLGFIVFAVVVVATFLVLRYVIKLQFPNLGRIASGLVLIGGTVLDQLNALPWGTILSDAEAKLVGFLIAAGMMILHVYDMTKTPAPPTPPAA